MSTTTAASDSPKPALSRRRRIFEVAVIVISQSSQSLAIGGLALFLPKIREDLGLTFTQAGSLSAASTLVYALMQIPSGYMADRFGPKRLYVIGLIGVNLLAINLSFAQSYWEALPNQALSGFFRSMVFAPGLLLISNWFPSERRATAMGLYVAGGFSSNIFLNTIGPVLIDSYSWRTLFFFFAFNSLMVTLLFAKFGGRGPTGTRSQSVSFISALTLFRHRAMWLIGGIQYVRLAVASGMAFWLPSFFVEDQGQSLQVAGLVVALGAVMTAPSNFLGGYVSDKIRNPYLVISVSLIMLAFTTSMLATLDSLPLLIGVVVINSIFVQVYFGPLFSLPVDLLGTKSAGLTSGFSNFFANMGGFTFAYTLGYVKDSTGSFSIGFYALSAMCIFGLSCTIALWRLRKTQITV